MTRSQAIARTTAISTMSWLMSKPDQLAWFAVAQSSSPARPVRNSTPTGCIHMTFKMGYSCESPHDTPQRFLSPPPGAQSLSPHTIECN
ncbi:Uncharacterised protein [Mycobacteroides abscessus subsp. abscessus]|nr:Uncharacterised protein [Mycobacteroides abscessus subsp. abscessus]